MSTMNSSKTDRPTSNNQRKKRLLRTARAYAKLYLARFQNKKSFSPRNFRLAHKQLAQAASDLATTARQPKTDQEKDPIVHLLGAAHGYRDNPNIDNFERLATMAINWHTHEQTKEIPTGETIDDHHKFKGNPNQNTPQSPHP